LPILIWGAVAFLGSSAAPGPWRLRFEWAYISSQAHDFTYSVMQFVPLWLPFGSSLLSVRLRYLYGISAIAFIGMAILAVVANRRIAMADAQRSPNRGIDVFVLFWLWVVGYFLVVALASLMTTPLPPAVSNRMLLPIFIGIVFAFVAGFSVVQRAWFTGPRSWLRALPWAVALWGAIYYIPQMIDDVAVPLHGGSGPTSYVWRDSQIIGAVRRLPDDIAIVSNHPHTIALWAERPALGMLENMQPSFVDQNTPYGSSPTDAAQVAFRDGAALVVFGDVLPQQLEDVFGQPARARASTLLDGLLIAGRYPEGVIYFSR
jgi:hypothetical protein